MNIFKPHRFPAVCLVMIGVYSFHNAHADLGAYNFTLKGNVTNTTCGVDETEAHKIVTLGKNATRQLKTPGERTSRVPIPFNLSQCPPNAEVKFTFIGDQSTANNQLLALTNATATTTAQHVAVEISDASGNRVPMNNLSRYPNDVTTSSRPFLVDASGNLSTVFYANYIATDASATAGTANAYAEFRIDYQ